MNTVEESNPGMPKSTPMTAEAIRNLQRYLRRLSYVDPSIPPVAIDGIFDERTRDSLIAFQIRAGLPPTGRADRETWELLYSAYLDVLFRASLPQPLPLFPIAPEGYTVGQGDKGFLVSAVQFLLSEISTLYDLPLAVEITGAFDDRTEEAIRSMQRYFRLPLTGRVDKRLWNYLIGAYSAEDLMREQT